VSEDKTKRKVSWDTVIVVLLVVCACALFLFPVLNGHGPRPRNFSISNLKQVALGHTMYLEDFDGFGPSPESWADQLMRYIKNRDLFASPHIQGPLEERKGQFGYAYYRPLGGVKEWAVQNPEEVPLVFDSSDLRWNANGDLSLLPDPPRWDGKNLIAFLDGHVKAVEGTPEVEIKLP
jgi:hypothetical protein